ncbi:MAG TPA: response regulator [Candidatus Binatia bacterium]|nr:response regulator [Candidatus Binatia bacterium]
MQTMHIEKRKLTGKAQKTKMKQILLIDDRKDSVLSTTLAREGYNVIRCDSVQKAWNLVYPRRPHLIIIRLQGLDGAGLTYLQECRVLAEGVPIILATSAHVNERLMKVLQHQTAAILDLPSMPETIREALQNLKMPPG